MTIKEKKDKRAGLVNQMRSLLNTAEKRPAGQQELTADEQTSYNNMEAELDKLGKEVDREERLLQIENNLRNRKDHDYRPGAPTPENNDKRGGKEYRDAMFKHFARYGKNGLNAEHVNTLTVGVDTEGGYLVPEEFERTMIENLVNSDPIRAGATVITTASDRNIPIETDTGSFGYVGENGQFQTSDPSVGRVVLSAFKTGGIIKVSDELLQDSMFDIEAYLQRLASRRYNALEQAAFANGNGVGQPLGLFQTVTVGTTDLVGKTGAVSASAAITSDDIMDTFHTLARAYRDRAAWITSDTMVKMLRKLKTGVSGDNTYLWQPGLTAGQPDRLLGRPVLVSDGAPAPAVEGRSIMFGDLSYYTIADRLGMGMQVLKELYAATGQVGFKFSRRNDARLTFAPSFTFFKHGAAS